MNPSISEQIRAAIKADRQRIARTGGLGRAKALSAERRREISSIAGRAARSAKASSAGGLGRAKALSAERRREIATKASKAAAKARTAKAKARKQEPSA